MKAAVIGSGAWGTALATVLVKNGIETTLWCRSEDSAAAIRETGENRRLSGVKLPDALRITSLPECVSDCSLVVFATPSFPIRTVCKTIAPYLKKDTVAVSVTKGIEAETLMRMSQIVSQETGLKTVALSGPCHAEEVARGIPTGCVAACQERALAEFVQDAFMADTFRVYTSPDMIGVELGGALKNVIALCAGITDGLGCGDNTKAMLMTRGLTEIARLGVSMGADKETFTGLSGVGDLIVTCTSMHSRNRRAGILIGQGLSPKAAMEQVGAVVEGYYAAKSAWELGQKAGIDMPITQVAHQVLYENVDVKESFATLLTRRRKPEPEDTGWL